MIIVWGLGLTDGVLIAAAIRVVNESLQSLQRLEKAPN